MRNIDICYVPLSNNQSALPLTNTDDCIDTKLPGLYLETLNDMQ